MELLPVRKRVAQVTGLLIVLAGCLPLGWGLSVIIGAISFNFGGASPPLAFRVQVFASVPLGALMISLGRRLAWWGLRRG